MVVTRPEHRDAADATAAAAAGGAAHEQAASSLLSVSLFLLWLRALRALSLLPSIGPLVLMVAKMTRDVAKWALLLLMVLLKIDLGIQLL